MISVERNNYRYIADVFETLETIRRCCVGIDSSEFFGRKCYSSIIILKSNDKLLNSKDDFERLR